MKAKNIYNLIQNTDFRLLGIQKKQLYLLQLAYPEKENKEVFDNLEGLINFLDAFQDMAVEYYRIDEKIVFPYLMLE